MMPAIKIGLFIRATKESVLARLIRYGEA